MHKGVIKAIHTTTAVMRRLQAMYGDPHEPDLELPTEVPVTDASPLNYWMISELVFFANYF